MKILILLTALLTINVNAIEYDIGIGYTQTAESGNGNWWQREFDHKLETSSPSIRLGLKFQPIDSIPQLKLLIGYSYLARVKSYAKASSSDNNYFAWRKGEAEIWPLSTWHGKGSVEGIYLNAEYNFKHFFIAGGWWLHKVKWKVDIPDWHSSLDFPTNLIVNPVPQSLTVTDNSTKVGVMLSAGKYFGNYRLAYTMAEVRGNQNYKPMHLGGAHNIELSYKF